MATDLTRPRSNPLPWLLAAGSLAVAGYFGWLAYGPEDHGDPITTSLAAFEKANRLTVFSAQLVPVVTSDDERMFGLLKSRQVAVIPARVDYTLDLSRLDANRLGWDKEAKRLDVTLPPLGRLRQRGGRGGQAPHTHHRRCRERHGGRRAAPVAVPVGP